VEEREFLKNEAGGWLKGRKGDGEGIGTREKEREWEVERDIDGG
jgi:hypothetical protein